MTTIDDLKTQLAGTNPDDVSSVMIRAGKENHLELEPDIAAFLESSSAMLRASAIRVLGFYWKIPAYRDRVIATARSSTDTNERVAAIAAWSAYDRNTRSSAALSSLLEIMTEQDVADQVRSAAYRALLVIGGLPNEERANSGSGLRAERIDWGMIARMLEGTGVQLPSPVPVPSTSGRLGVSRVTFDTGGEGTPLGRLVLDFDGETLMVHLRQELGDVRREWMAALPTATWENIVSTFERCGFPGPPPAPSGGFRPGVQFTTLSWLRHGEVQSIRFSRDGAEYGRVNMIMFPIIAQIAPELDEGFPASWSTPETKIETPFELTAS